MILGVVLCTVVVATLVLPNDEDPDSISIPTTADPSQDSTAETTPGTDTEASDSARGVDLTTTEGFHYRLTYESFETTTEDVPPPYVGVKIRLSATNTGDRGFDIHEAFLSSSPSIKVETTADKVPINDDCDDVCVGTSTFLPDVQSGILAPGESVEGPLLSIGDRFDPSITKQDIMLYAGPPDVGGDPAAGYVAPEANDWLPPPP